jgi:hypothetical protein
MTTFRIRIHAAALACVLALNAGTLSAQVQPTFLYSLSSFGGPLRDSWPRVYVDESGGEVYLITQNLVRIYNASGMELFAFGDGLDLGMLLDVAVEKDGNILLLSSKDAQAHLTRCNYRGVPIGPIEIKNLPAGLVFAPNRLVLRNGLFYFASYRTSSVIVTDDTGEFRKAVDFIPLLDGTDRQKEGAEIFGFTVDSAGDMFFTIPVLFKVYKFSSDGVMTWFGRGGAAPGRFGIVAGIAVDVHGDILVADKLKSAVIVFDKTFNFLAEFGYRGPRPENLIIPDQIATGPGDKVYVSHGLRRGVSVFALTAK